MNNIRSGCIAVLAVIICLTGCASGYVRGPFRARVFDAEARQVQIRLQGVEHGLFLAPCGIQASRAAWTIYFDFDNTPAKVYDVRRASKVEFSGISKQWSQGTLSITADGRKIDVRLSRNENGKQVPWEHNGQYPVDR